MIAFVFKNTILAMVCHVDEAVGTQVRRPVKRFWNKVRDDEDHLGFAVWRGLGFWHSGPWGASRNQLSDSPTCPLPTSLLVGWSGLTASYYSR